MTILIYGEKASRTHENQMLFSFLEKLEARWAYSDDWIFVIANAFWNNAEIDLVCILPSAIIVIDFKNYSGIITGTENGSWQVDKILVKGGRKSNPYQQLRDNKFSIISWLESKELLLKRNLGHISAGVIFSGEIKDKLDLPPKVRSWFYLTDLNSCSILLDSLASPELNIAYEEALKIIKTLGVQELKFPSKHPKIHLVGTSLNQPQKQLHLTEQQQRALQTLFEFLNTSNIISFSVLGMTSTGKSCLLAEVAKRISKQVIILYPNRRLADQSELKEAQSIYSHLYIGTEKNNEQEKITYQKNLEVIPLRKCEDDDDCVYLIDDAHLLSDAKFLTPDGKQYGSGHLLSDFFEFAALGKTKRKVIYFGDPYQLQRSSNDKSVLLGSFQKSKELLHQDLELTQLIDISGTVRLMNALKLVSAIRSKQYAILELDTDQYFRIINKQDTAQEICNLFKENPTCVWYLAETHKKGKLFNDWIRKKLFKKEHLDSIEVGDLVEIYVSPQHVDEFDSCTPIYSGQRVKISEVNRTHSYQQTLKGRDNPIKFHSIECRLNHKENTAYKIDIFEEFLISEKPELDQDTAIAENVWRRQEEEYQNKQKKYNEALKKSNQTNTPNQLKTKLSEPKKPDPPLPRPEFTYARYGYATTVHHAQGMSQPICYINCDHSAGRHSEVFFRWLYSAVTVAKDKVVLFNYTPIHPFSSTEWKIDAGKIDKNIPIGRGWSFRPSENPYMQDRQTNLPQGLSESKSLSKSISIWLRVTHLIQELGWKVTQARCHDYQEHYHLINEQGNKCLLKITYNKKIRLLLCKLRKKVIQNY